MYLFVHHIGTVNHTFRGMPSLVPSERHRRTRFEFIHQGFPGVKGYLWAKYSVKLSRECFSLRSTLFPFPDIGCSYTESTAPSMQLRHPSG
jgi:hypothetical protein